MPRYGHRLACGGDIDVTTARRRGGDPTARVDRSRSSPHHRPAPDGRFTARDLALIASFAALIAVLGQVPGLYLFGGDVPVTLQTLGVMLTGCLLGLRRGCAAVALLLALAAAGLPLLSSGSGGLAAFTGPTGGYLFGFLVGVGVTGLLAERAPRRAWTPWLFVANVLGCIAVVYAIGVPFLMWRTGLSLHASLWTGAAIFLPGDFSKATVATVIAAGVRRGYPTLTDKAARTRTPSR